MITEAGVPASRRRARTAHRCDARRARARAGRGRRRPGGCRDGRGLGRQARQARQARGRWQRRRWRLDGTRVRRARRPVRSGVGARSYLETTCYTSSLGYPKLLDTDANLRLTAFPACSGASTATVITAQVPVIPTSAKRVTVTAGGNDIGFASIMQNCFVIVSSTCESKIVAGEALVSNGTVAANVTAAVQAIRARAPEARILVAGYPLLFHEPNARYQWAARVNAGTIALNDAIAAAAGANGAVFVDVEVAFAGHGVGSPSPWINDWSWLRTTDGFHPNATGHTAYAVEIRKVIG